MVEPAWIGRRVSLRRTLDDAAHGRPRYGDIVGELVGLPDDRAVVATRAGTVAVAVADVVAARPVPPSTAEELALARTMADGWRAEETEDLGGWLLRASGGFTNRANSVLVAGRPGMPLDEALERVSSWYRARGRAPVLQVPTEARRLLDAELGERGWQFSHETHVLVRTLGDAPPEDHVQLTGKPSPGWLGLYRGGSAVGDPHAYAVLTRHPAVVFAQIMDGAGQVVASGRGTTDGGWLGITCVEADPGRRRSGLATRIVRALLHWGAAHGAGRVHVEIAEANAASLALFDSLGFWHHHTYRYRHPPGE